MNVTWFDKFLMTEGRMAPIEGALLHALALAACRNTSSGVILELGTFRGRSACAIGAACKLVGMRLITIDNWCQSNSPSVGPSSREIAERNLADVGLADTVTVIEGNTREHRLLGGLSMIFIDAGHDKGSVIADFETWWGDLQRGGIVAFHDCGAPGVAAALVDLRARYPIGLVAMAGAIQAFQKAH